jgi:hypothetical protein
MPASQAAPFHRRGLAYFWVLNDRCEWAHLEAQLQAFAALPDLTALCIHPRAGLLLPYGGAEWFDLVRRICLRAAELGIRIWLYDEDPYTSGHAGGRILAERPDLIARGLQLSTYDPCAQGDKTLFGFPLGNLIWCGLVNEKTGEAVDLTERVGVVRRRWEIHDAWDSRFFYPDTPLYTHANVSTHDPEFALTVPTIPAGMKLVAVVAREALFKDCGPWGHVIDTLNPEAARLFLESTHEPYRRSVGGMFGKEIEALFTDEPKMFDLTPWTPGLLEDFQREQGYDIRPRLHYLFANHPSNLAWQTRLEYRAYTARRFVDAWVRPVARWCRKNGLKFVGHVSPEDDPVEQGMLLGNLLPIMKEFDLCGIDLIIPAVGDQRHPLLNVGVVCAVSVAQQQGKAGVLSETGHGCDDMQVDEVRRILLWQAMMGVTTTVLHCAFESTRGPRDLERPDFGPNGPLWEKMPELHREIAAIQEHIHGARQIAPVAILWPIRTYNAEKFSWPEDTTGLRRELIDLLAGCLDRQVGVHVIDEADLIGLRVTGGWATMGWSRYTHILIPSCTILHERTVKKLRALARAGIRVVLAGRLPTRMQDEQGVGALDMAWCEGLRPEAAVDELPRVADLSGDGTDIRCTVWAKHGNRQRMRLLMNLRTESVTVRIGNRRRILNPGVVWAERESCSPDRRQFSEHTKKAMVVKGGHAGKS